MNSQTLALCIPAYNAESYLPRLLRSAQKQHIPFDEILVYNDCSTDNTESVALALGAKVINGDKNRGCSFGKNKLAQITTCDWIHFHDADDDLGPNFTSLAHKWMNKSDAPDVILFDFEYRDNNTGELLAKSDFNDEQLQSDPIRYAILNQINNIGLYSRKRFIEFGGFNIDQETMYNEDVDFHCKLAILGASFRAEKEVSITILRYSQSMSASNQVKCAQAHYQVMKRNADKVGDKYAKEIAQKLWHNAIICASLNDWNTCKDSISLALHLYGKIPVKENILVKLISQISPYRAIWTREKLIRTFRPHLR